MAGETICNSRTADQKQHLETEMQKVRNRSKKIPIKILDEMKQVNKQTSICVDKPPLAGRKCQWTEEECVLKIVTESDTLENAINSDDFKEADVAKDEETLGFDEEYPFDPYVQGLMDSGSSAEESRKVRFGERPFWKEEKEARLTLLIGVTSIVSSLVISMKPVE
mgnify:CR=1 FL=1